MWLSKRHWTGLSHVCRGCAKRWREIPIPAQRDETPVRNAQVSGERFRIRVEDVPLMPTSVLADLAHWMDDCQAQLQAALSQGDDVAVLRAKLTQGGPNATCDGSARGRVGGAFRTRRRAFRPILSATRVVAHRCGFQSCRVGEADNPGPGNRRLRTQRLRAPKGFGK